MQETTKNPTKKIGGAQKGSHYNNLLNTRENDVNMQKARLKNQKEAKTDTQKNANTFQWLTEHSRNFLAAGYVEEGTKPEIRIREIADRAEKILGIQGYSDKFYNYMSEGKFPKNIHLGTKISVWIEREIQEWINSQILLNRQ